MGSTLGSPPPISEIRLDPTLPLCWVKLLCWISDHLLNGVVFELELIQTRMIQKQLLWEKWAAVLESFRCLFLLFVFVGALYVAWVFFTWFYFLLELFFCLIFFLRKPSTPQQT
jgi:hypothetical protein